MSNVSTKSTFEVKQHAEHKRLVHIEIDNAALYRFLEIVSKISVERLEYVPFMRFFLAEKLREVMGEDLQHKTREILHDRNTGGFTIGVQNQSTEIDDYIKFSTALTHLVGISNYDEMSGKYYARFSVKHTFDSDTYLRQAYRVLELHTDGTFVNEKTDWVLMMKFEEENANGGESRLLHLDDWEDLQKFKSHPLSSYKYKFSYADRGSKKVDDVLYNTTFFDQNNSPCIRYNHQCTHPLNIEQAAFLKEIQDSMEESAGVIPINLPLGQLVMINNNFWLHGREAFSRNENLHRELMRQRGSFSTIQ
ncbi:carbon starvation induced protein CsiD [Peribacillus cavernae]|uniref:Carbon starvation induced protein CsiD n=1 Tax=Peribacillus cavernae TaxID=1674310 RepID=A0A433HX66_9BACI|nr:glutarate dioxygenase GlaH [Peribacillus cavernae]MDQ0221136.1 protein CsiD [Peribacillus cavernae]RUQ32824.1 carbon starvation induced protein CsiD [Peribacillus cavernae]